MKYPLVDFINAIDGKISEAYTTDVNHFAYEGNKLGVYCEAPKNNSNVRMITVDDEINNRVYRWISPDYYDEYVKEHEEKGLNPEVYVDDIKFIMLEFTEILNLIKNTLSKEIVSFDVTEEEYNTIMAAADEMNMTIDEFCEYAIKKKLAEDGLLENDPIE